MLGRTFDHLEIHRLKLGPYKIVPCLLRCSDSDGMVFIEKEGELKDSKASSIYGLCRSKLISSMETKMQEVKSSHCHGPGGQMVGDQM